VRSGGQSRDFRGIFLGSHLDFSVVDTFDLMFVLQGIVKSLLAVFIDNIAAIERDM
jgi:hypothetical protein